MNQEFKKALELLEKEHVVFNVDVKDYQQGEVTQLVDGILTYESSDLYPEK